MSTLLHKLQMSLNRLQLEQQAPPVTPEMTFMVAVSGGRDSVALLHGLLSCGWRNLVVCHVNHHLRGRSADLDAELVQQWARQLSLPVEVGSYDVRQRALADKSSIELAARHVRDEFFAKACLKYGARHVFLGHHADDQAETILGNLCRGTGLRGLAGMTLVSEAGQGRGAAEGSTDISFLKVRPLLQVTRAEIHGYVQQQGLNYREDDTNHLLIYRRNRLRHEVLPLLNEVFQREVSPIMVRMGIQAHRDEDCLRTLATQFLDSASVIDEAGSLKITSAMMALHDAVLSRVLMQWLERIGESTGIGSEQIEAAMQLLRSRGAPAGVNLPGQRSLRRKARRLTVKPLEGRSREHRKGSSPSRS